MVSEEYQLGGIEVQRERLSDSSRRKTLLEDIAININRRGGPNSLPLVETEDPQWSGVRLDAVAASLEVEQAEAAARLISQSLRYFIRYDRRLYQNLYKETLGREVE